MKSCLGLLITLLILIAVVGTGAGIWYLSQSATITRQGAPGTPAVPAPAPPKAGGR